MRISLSCGVLAALVAACHIEHFDDRDRDAHHDAGIDAPDSASAPCDGAATAIEHATVLAMELGSVPLPDTTVIVRDQRIAWLGPARGAPVSSCATRIDATGRWLLPGLVDAHVHIANPRMMRLMLQDPTIREDAIADADLLLPFVASGVLQVGNLAAMSEAIGQRRAIETGGVLGPHL